MKKKFEKKAWAITDWGGNIKNLSVSIYDTKKEALEDMKIFDSMPDPEDKGERQKIIRVIIKEI